MALSRQGEPSLSCSSTSAEPLDEHLAKRLNPSHQPASLPTATSNICPLVGMTCLTYICQKETSLLNLSAVIQLTDPLSKANAGVDASRPIAIPRNIDIIGLEH